mgnify:CR=1 FL=1
MNTTHFILLLDAYMNSSFTVAPIIDLDGYLTTIFDHYWHFVHFSIDPLLMESGERL